MLRAASSDLYHLLIPPSSSAILFQTLIQGLAGCEVESLYSHSCRWEVSPGIEMALASLLLWAMRILLLQDILLSNELKRSSLVIMAMQIQQECNCSKTFESKSII